MERMTLKLLPMIAFIVILGIVTRDFSTANRTAHLANPGLALGACNDRAELLLCFVHIFGGLLSTKNYR